MPSEFVWNQFSAGWCPSDDSQNGRKNALLRMDNVELDINGALSLIGGKSLLHSYDGPAYELFSGIAGGSEHLYAVTRTEAGGSIYRDGTNLLVPASSTAAAISQGLGSVLIASGDTRIKDLGTGFEQLGLTEVLGPTLAIVPGNYSQELIVDGTTLQWYGNDNSPGARSTGTFNFTAGTQYDVTVTVNSIGYVISPPINLSTLANGGAGSLPEDPTDQIAYQIGMGLGYLADLLGNVSLSFISANGRYTVVDSISGSHPNFANFQHSRSDFAITGSPDWSAITNFEITFSINPLLNDQVIIQLTPIPIIDSSSISNHFAFYNGINNGSLPALISYTAIAVNQNSVYTAMGGGLDALDNVAKISVPPYTNVQLTFTALADPQITNLWIYREGGNLNQWFRVLVEPNTSGNYIDNVYDTIALDTDIVLDIDSVSVKGSTFLPVINEIIGPMQGRWFYFTDDTIYPSASNDPDLIASQLAITMSTTSDSEVFMWAIKVAEGYILVGTSADVYVLSGTFTTLPNGEIDVYYRPMVCQFPPITKQATFANGLIYYMAMDGWRSLGTDASTSILMVAPNTDLIYKGVSRYGYSGVNLDGFAVGTQFFPIVATRNKLYCCVNDRIEVYDFTRKYWRTFAYGFSKDGILSDATAAGRTILGAPLVAYGDNNVYKVDNILTADVTPQTVSILSSIFDPTNSLNRNDLYTLKIRLLTGQDENLNISIVTKDNTTFFIGSVTSSTDIEIQKNLDLNSIIPFPTETFQFLLTGNFTRLVISDIRIDYDTRPQQLTTVRGFNTNFGTAGRKRLRMWPIVIDTLGNEVTFHQIIDNVSGSTQIINTTDKTTIPIFYNFDAFGTDYGYLLTGGPFEFWEMGQPEVVQSLPTPKRYDQVGPQELFRYGKIRELEFRLLPYGGEIGSTSQLPYVLYFDDYSIYNNTLTINNGQEQSYNVGLPKGVAGTIVRIELGPTNFDFIRYYIRAKVMLHGSDVTDNSRWITL
jgi:hypothetical protein